ncbi:MAG: sugar ABC transporter ATP-binding protein [Planctomycetaceae bacterium]|nr:sugar ABC transporter ATP-binding protein [Planctomycetaceae bacterium]
MNAPRPAPAEPPKIALQGIGRSFPGVRALDDVSFEIARGHMHAIAGENGAGKSTLMKILSGVLPADEGCLLLDGRPVQFAGPREAQAAGINIIHQELSLVEELHVTANLFLGRELQGRCGLLDEREMNRQAASLFEQLQCSIPLDAPAGSLRIGDQQLVEIARSLLFAGDVLIMDEPTSALTEAETGRLFRIIDQLLQQGLTILYISHKMSEIFRRADCITVLRDGRHVATVPAAETTPEEVTRLMVGREITAHQRPGGMPSTGPGQHTAAAPPCPVLQVEQLSLPWPGHARQWRLKDISFELSAGEIVGVAGLMGAGRTELLECLYGATQEVPAGRILLDGQLREFRHPAEAVAAGIALVTEDRKRLGLFDQLTVRENISLCSLGQVSTGGLITARRERDVVQAAMTRLGVRAASAETPIASLSGGNQQKCILARCLEIQPRVLLLDDPTRGVDVGAKSELYAIIEQLRAEGIAILLTSSELPELLTLSDRILVLAEGRLTAAFERGEFSEEAIMAAATEGVAISTPSAE